MDGVISVEALHMAAYSTDGKSKFNCNLLIRQALRLQCQDLCLSRGKVRHRYRLGLVPTSRRSHRPPGQLGRPACCRLEALEQRCQFSLTRVERHRCPSGRQTIRVVAPCQALFIRTYQLVVRTNLSGLYAHRTFDEGLQCTFANKCIGLMAGVPNR